MTNPLSRLFTLRPPVHSSQRMHASGHDRTDVTGRTEAVAFFVLLHRMKHVTQNTPLRSAHHLFGPIVIRVPFLTPS